MKRSEILLIAFLFISLILPIMAQDDAFLSAQEESVMTETSTFRDVIFSGGLIGLLTWVGIFLCFGLLLPIGVASIVHAVRSRDGSIPLATKLLGFVMIWAIVLGFLGFSQGAMYAFFCLSDFSGPSLTARLVLDIAHAILSLSAAMIICLINLLFFLPTIILLHNRRKKAQDA